MKNSLIDNQGLSLPHEKKTKLESQIGQLKSQERQISQQLKLWESKLKKAHNLANCLEATDKFASQFLTAKIESEKAQEQPDTSWLECLIRHQVEFNLKFAAGAEAFTELVFKSTERQVRTLKVELDKIQNQLLHQERKFARLQARRQGKTLLECKLNNGLGCLGIYQCENCQVNYPIAPQSEALKGGAY
jgi:hypothetical protein